MKNSKELAKDFESFINAHEITPPAELSQKILKHVNRDLNPKMTLVFFKLVLIHVITGSAVLSFCPQFGIGYFSHMGIMHYFMHFWPTVCTMLCGGIFLGTSTFVSAFFLKNSELNLLKKNRFSQISFLAIISLLAFILLGAEVIFALGIAWFVGSFIFGLLSLEVGSLFRSRLQAI